ncbi:hypothetical protein AnigIFM50267_011023 [Aspergillus niger]|nr:hypothetical protein AnigIFM50267_011023 [Aspergillus niger]
MKVREWTGLKKKKMEGKNKRTKEEPPPTRAMPIEPKLLPANDFRAPVAANDRVALASVALQINFNDDDPATLHHLDSAPSQTLESSAAV